MEVLGGSSLVCNLYHWSCFLVFLCGFYYVGSKFLGFPGILVEDKDAGKVTVTRRRFLEKVLYLLPTFGY